MSKKIVIVNPISEFIEILETSFMEQGYDVFFAGKNEPICGDDSAEETIVLKILPKFWAKIPGVPSIESNSIHYRNSGQPCNEITEFKNKIAAIAQKCEEAETVKINAKEELIKAFRLTNAQAKVLRVLGQGCTNNEIAVRLGIRCRTVEAHLCAILYKTKLKNRGQLMSLWSLFGDNI
jgi:DNA-binding CsgD family transcriptional regulator